MAVIVDTSFEDYADGVPGPVFQQSLVDHGWVDSSIGVYGVVSSNAHTGSKSVYIQGAALQRNTGYLGRSVTMQSWVKSATGEPLTNGRSLQVGSHLGVDGVSRGPISLFQPTGTQDVSLLIYDTVIATVPNVFTPDTYQKLRLEVRFSTVNTLGTDVNMDGCVRGYVDDALVLSVSDTRVYVSTVQWSTFQNEWDLLYWDVDGFLDDVYADDDALPCGSDPGDDPDIPPNESDPCCGGHPDPTNPTGPNPGETPVFPPLQPWDRECETTGDVPTAADVVDAESWSL